jgi:hypothetical protein
MEKEILRPETKNFGKETEEHHTRTPLAHKIECLNSQGYDKEFSICEEGLRCLNTGEIFQPEDVKILEHQRFEGTSDPDYMAILYIIETKNGLKGSVVDAFGVYANPELFDFMKKVPDFTINNISESTIKNCWNEFQK